MEMNSLRQCHYDTGQLTLAHSALLSIWSLWLMTGMGALSDQKLHGKYSDRHLRRHKDPSIARFMVHPLMCTR